MDEKLQKIFIINMAASETSVEMIADTVNMPKEKVLAIIEQNQETIEKKRKDKEQKENGKRLRNKTEIRDENSEKIQNKVQFKNDRKKKEAKQSMLVTNNSKYRVFNDIRKNIMLGKPYDLELLKKLTEDVKKGSVYKKDREIIGALTEIYVQLNMFTKAKAIVREIYDEDQYYNNCTRDSIISEIEERELTYNIMKLHRRGLSSDTISQELRVYTIDVISEIKQQKELDNQIIQMHEDGMSKEEIVDLININIERINLALSSKTSPNKNEADER